MLELTPEAKVYLGFLGVIALLRLGELVISKRNWRHHVEQERHMLTERVFPFMVLLHLSMFALLPLELILRRPTFGGPVSWIALVLTGLALVLRFWTLRTMGRSWNVRVVFGDTYPIVDNGPYRFIRHPNYLVVVLELLCLPLIFKLYFSAAFLSLINALVLRVRIRAEESVLARNPEWVARMAHKPRFLPGLGSGSGS